MLSTRSRYKVLQELQVFQEKERQRKGTCILKEEEKKSDEWRRKKIKQEIFSSEKTYQKHLNLIVMHFKIPLEACCIVPADTLTCLFGNIEQIQNMNRELIHQLEHTTVGEAFLYLAPFLKLYSMYANNHQRALATLQDWETKSSSFASWKENQERRPEVMGLKFNALLITPVQRIPRYKMLLEDLLSHTSRSDEDYANLKDATQQISEVASHINDHIRQHDNFQKMLSIQKSVVGTGMPRILGPGRQFIKEGILRKISRKGGKSHDRMFFLFSDILLYAKPKVMESGRQKYQFCCVMPLHHCRIERMFGSSSNHDSGAMFKITCKAEDLLLYSDNKDIIHSWLEELEKYIGDVKECRQSLRKESSAKEPIRRPDLMRRTKRKITREENKEITSHEQTKKQKIETNQRSIRHPQNTRVLECSSPFSPVWKRRKSKLKTGYLGNHDITLSSDTSQIDWSMILKTDEEKHLDLSQMTSIPEDRSMTGCNHTDITQESTPQCFTIKSDLKNVAASECSIGPLAAISRQISTPIQTMKSTCSVS